MCYTFGGFFVAVGVAGEVAACLLFPRLFPDPHPGPWGAWFMCAAMGFLIAAGIVLIMVPRTIRIFGGRL